MLTTVVSLRWIVVLDIVTGALEERRSDWYAQDASDNVWYFGEDTKEYTNGVVCSTPGSWEADVDGALPGIIMQAGPVQEAMPTDRSTGRRLPRTWPSSGNSAPRPTFQRVAIPTC